MKKGDTISKDVEVKEGDTVALSFESQATAQSWINKTGAKSVKIVPIEGELPVKYNVVASIDHTRQVDAKVNWIVENEVSIDIGKGEHKIIDLLEEPDWRVTSSAPPSFQSSVAQMSDDDIKQKIEELRGSRKHIPQPKVRGSRVSKSDPISKALAGMSKEKKEALLKKLGMSEE